MIYPMTSHISTEKLEGEALGMYLRMEEDIWKDNGVIGQVSVKWMRRDYPRVN
jgi:hypothetical protein